MDTLWDPSYDQATQGSSYLMGLGWQCDFYFGYGLDVIEETALNEKSCIQVLKILVRKEDNEIVELEEDLVILQSQLAWADEEWSEFCCASLREKIDCLNISLQSLKNENVRDYHDFGNCLPMHREPAERLHDIVKALLRNYFQQKDEQFVDVIEKELSSDHGGHATELLVERKQTSNSATNTIINKELKETIITFDEEHAISKTFLKTPQKRKSYPGTAKRANAIAKGSSLDSSRLVAGLTNGKRLLSNFDSKRSRKVEADNHNLTPMENCMTKKSFLKYQVKRRKHLEPVNSQPVVRNSCLNAEKLAIVHAEEESILSNSNSKIRIENSAKKSSTTSARILDESLEPGTRRKDLQDKEKSAIAIVKDSSSRCATDYKGEINLSNIDTIIIREEEIKAQCSKEENIILGSSLELRGKGTAISDTVKSTDAYLDSRSDALKEANEDSNAKPTLKNGPEAVSEKIDISNTPLKKEKKRIATPRVVTVREFSNLTDSDHFAADTLLEMLNQRENTTKVHPKKKQSSQPKQVRKAEVVAADDLSNSILSSNSHKHRLKRDHQSTQESFKEPCLSVELGLHSYSRAKFRRQHRADKNISLSQSANREINKKKAQSEDLSLVSDVSQSTSQKRRKPRSSCSPVLEGTKEFRDLQISLTKCHDDTTDGTTEDHVWIADCHLTDPDIETAKLLPSPTVTHPTRSIVDVDCLTLVDLRAIAKQQNLRGYRKLRKAELVEQLGRTLDVRGGMKRKRKEPASLPRIQDEL